MRFCVDKLPFDQDVPAVVLSPDKWDDYGFKATFEASLHLPGYRITSLGPVKIIMRGQTRGQTELPVQDFAQLGSEYCSLGQTTSYYEKLHQLGPEVYRPFLDGICDIAFRPEIEAGFSDEPGLRDSLLRFPAAERTLIEARAIFVETRPASSEPLSFTYELPSGDVTTNFLFGTEEDAIPRRLCVVIGYNGAGKTRLLAHLAMLAHADRHEATSAEFTTKYGRYVRDRPTFGAIVAISYSAFDDFEIPGQGEGENATLDRERAAHGALSASNYRYCGLRQLDARGRIQTSLKSIDELTDEFHQARARVIEQERADLAQHALRPLREEPSFQAIVEIPDIAAVSSDWREMFSQLSTGHKIVLNIVMQLCAHLEKRSLVLLDEPELHLHPPLLAAALRAMGVLLRRHDSYAVIATHSPVVLQEVPARGVKILRRNFDRVTIETPEIETFAENLGLLTKHVFNLDSSKTDFQGVLRELAKLHTISEIEVLFDGRLSSQARSLVLSMQLASEKKADADH